MRMREVQEQEQEQQAAAVGVVQLNLVSTHAGTSAVTLAATKQPYEFTYENEKVCLETRLFVLI